MFNRLKSVYPFSEIARLIDLNFSKLEDIFTRLEVLERKLAQSAESETALVARFEHSDSSLREEFEAISQRHYEIAQNDVALLKAFSYVVEGLRQLQTTQTENGGGRGLVHAVEMLNGQLADVLVRTRRREAEVLDTLQEVHAQLTQLGDNRQLQHTLDALSERTAAARGSFEERSARMQSSLSTLCSQVSEALSLTHQQDLDMQNAVTALRRSCDGLLTSFRQQSSQADAAATSLREGIGGVDSRLQEVQAAGLDRDKRMQEAMSGFRGLMEDVNARLQQSDTTRGNGYAQLQQGVTQTLGEIQSSIQGLRQRVDEFEAQVTEGIRGETQVTTDGLQALEQKLLEELQGIRIRPETAEFDLLNPDVRLLAYLYSFLSCRVAVDIGANIGDVSERLLRAGFEVYAFEPFRPIFEAMEQRLSGRQGFHPNQIAIGFVDRSMDLHIAADQSAEGKYRDTTTLYSSLVRHSMLDDLQFTRKEKVQVRSVESLQKSGELPAEIGLMKVDTEGYDLEVIRGMGECRPSVLMAEFWDPKMAFGRSGAINLLEELVAEMQERDYRWYIVIYRLDGKPTSYYCNQPLSPPTSWGNVLFFRDRNVFGEAREWCKAVLPPTYF